MDLDDFLAPLNGANPSGLDLRNEARFHAIERLLEPAARNRRIEAERAGGAGTVPLDWAQVLADARDLATVGRDLRLLVIVARALANDEGLAGLAKGLGLLRDTVAMFWDSAHPALRENPSKREAALRRINAVYQIENADNGLLCDLEFNLVLSPRGLGPVTGADLAASAINRVTFLAESPSGLGDKEQAALVAAHEARVARVATACRATAAERPEQLEEILSHIGAARAGLAALEEALNVHVTENGMGVRFAVLGTLLARMEQTLAAGKSASAATSATNGVADMPISPEPSSSSAAATSPNGAAIPGQLSSRRDVERCLDLIINFYERTEPSSPIPHLALRMRKMVPMNFMQLMEEIAPSGMKEFRNVAGVFDEKPK